MERFLLLHEEATAFIRNEPSAAARLIADYVAIVDRDFVHDTLLVSPKYCAKLTAEYIASTMRFVPILKQNGYIAGEISRDRIFFPDIMERIHPEQGHYSDGIMMGA